MSDTDRMYRLLCERPNGVHTHDLRKMGYSGNPSQRATDIERKYGVPVQRERERRNGRNGSRFKLAGVGAGSDSGSVSQWPGIDSPGRTSVDSGEGSTGGRAQAHAATGTSGAPARSVPSMFDADVEWA